MTREPIPVSAEQAGELSVATADSRLWFCVDADPLDGGYVVMCMELPGCASQGETVGDALRNVADAYEGILAVVEQPVTGQGARAAEPDRPTKTQDAATAAATKERSED